MTNNRVKWDIVFPQKVIQFNFLGVFPPLLPVAPLKVGPVCVFHGDARVPNTGIEPHVEDLGGVVIGVQAVDLGDRDAPL